MLLRVAKPFSESYFVPILDCARLKRWNIEELHLALRSRKMCIYSDGRRNDLQ
jgi:hypothetical protein